MDNSNLENVDKRHEHESFLDCSISDKTEIENTSITTTINIEKKNESQSVNKKKEGSKIKKEEDKKKREIVKERVRLEKLEAIKKKEEEKERLKHEKNEELKKKEAERERVRLEKIEEIKKKEEEKRKKEEEKEKIKQEKLEKERLRLELLNARNEEKKKKEDEKRRKDDKIRQQFCNYFIKKDFPLINQREDEEKNLRFLPFQIKKNMHLPPICRRVNFELEKEIIKTDLDKYLTNQDNNIDYLNELKQGLFLPRSFPRTLRKDQHDDDCIELKNKISRFRVKYLHFDPRDYRRPPYYGTWRKNSKIISPKNPFLKDIHILDYEVDSDDEWEDEGEGESIDNSGDEDDMTDEEDEDDDGFFVPHGHLSDDEIDEENRIVEPELKKAHEQVQREQWENERKKYNNILITTCIGCIWNEKTTGFNELSKFKIVSFSNNIFPININPNDEDKNGVTNKAKNNNSSDQASPSIKSKIKTKTIFNNNHQNNQLISQNSTPSIAKFINNISLKKEKQIINGSLNEQNIYKNNIAAEKRICSDTDETNVKRLKLENLSSDKTENDSEFKKPEIEIDMSQECQNKENEVFCITLE